jgi:DNA-binding NarL/FixJ family response regulator
MDHPVARVDGAGVANQWREGQMTGLNAHPTLGGLDFYFGGFQHLMPNRVQHILLVSSLYELFILEEDGLLNELITSEYMEMQLSHPPTVARAATGEGALEYIERHPVDLVITRTRIGDLRISEFARAAKHLRPGLPVIVLANEPRDLTRDSGITDRTLVDRAFVWTGDVKILLAIIKFVEDQLNAEFDTRVGDVRIIILVENSVRFYSNYLPLIYTELMKLTQSLMAEGANRMQRLLRQRARPRILLADTFEEAVALHQRYSDNLLGVISDVRFPRGGVLDRMAGIEFSKLVRAESPYLPVLLQSSDAAHRATAEALRVSFIHKRSPTLLAELREFILSNLGFGDFVFEVPDGTVVGRAHDLRSLEEALAQVPEASVVFHAEHNHFSNWLMARTEFEIASRIRAKTLSDFGSTEEVRRYLIRVIREYRQRTRSGLIADFSPKQFDTYTTFTRIGRGSMGGKARGLAFANALIRHHGMRNRYKGVSVSVPTSAALSTDVFDDFLRQNRLASVLAGDPGDDEIKKAFIEAQMPGNIYYDLEAFLRQVRYPLAVRSSSLLEDAQDRPFAGIYSTHMIPNNHADIDVRLEQLCNAIKLVYASAFSRVALQYLEATGHHSEEEKMGVVLQEIVGSAHRNRFYPTFSGVARSCNYYPIGQMKPDDGVVAVALGLGKTVVDEGQSLMFSPPHPEVLPQFASITDMLANSQRHFWALDLDYAGVVPGHDSDANLLKLGLDVAEADGTLDPIGSVYSAENDAVSDGIHRAGTRLVTFAHVLKSDLFPLAEIVQSLLSILRQGMACPVEIEFAVDMTTKPMRFAFLQVRPAISDEECADVSLQDVAPHEAFCFTPLALGNGQMCDISDIVYVTPGAFDASKTVQIAAELGAINDKLRRADRTCILIGPGRWGTADRWLGIPVNWDQISTARCIVETTLPGFAVTLSQGTHFFQNLTSMGIGYFTVQPDVQEGFIDWTWLEAQRVVNHTNFVRHVVCDRPVAVKIDGRTRRGVILKPAKQGE